MWCVCAKNVCPHTGVKKSTPHIRVPRNYRRCVIPPIDSNLICFVSFFGSRFLNLGAKKLVALNRSTETIHWKRQLLKSIRISSHLPHARTSQSTPFILLRREYKDVLRLSSRERVPSVGVVLAKHRGAWLIFFFSLAFLFFILFHLVLLLADIFCA